MGTRRGEDIQTRNATSGQRLREEVHMKFRRVRFVLDGLDRHIIQLVTVLLAKAQKERECNE